MADRLERRNWKRAQVRGIRAQTQRGNFGRTWWASRWIAALERLVDPGRLARGRSYARSGHVLVLDVGQGKVTARVQGSRPTPYRVSLHFRTLSDAEWDRVTDAMASEAVYAARLLAGEMPEQMEDVFQKVGVSLFPATRGDLETACSCPDWSNPCKHIAAVHYLLGERFDADPFLMFHLRGRTREAIIEVLRARRTEGSIQDPEEEKAGPQVLAPQPVYSSPDSFWSFPAGEPELPLHFETPEIDGLPVKVLGAPPWWRDRRGFAAVWERLYRAVSDHALALALGAVPTPGRPGRRTKPGDP